MAIISVNKVKKEFDDVTIVEDVSFDIHPGQRVGLVGRNGSGKTTLFRLITGEYETDEGTITIASNIKVGVLAQIPEYPQTMTVEGVLRTAFSDVYKLSRRMEELERGMAEGDKSAIREYGEVTSAFEAVDGYNVDVELTKVANGLKIGKDMLASPFNLLSGGERTKINLGRMILMNVDLMLLDEPTNHLDIQSVEWLEEFLRDFKGTALIISHDRYFLDRTVDKVLEIENCNVKMWEGNYSAFVRQKDEWLKAAENRIKQDEKKIAQLDFTIRRLHWMGTEKMHKKAFSMEKRVARIRNSMPQVVREGRNVRASFGSAARSGEDVLTVQNLKKSFGERVLFSEVNLEVKKDDRIGIVGSNGTGKSTLVKILLGDEPYDGGRIRWGEGIKSAFLPQIISFKNERMTVLDYLIDELGVSPAEARNRLGSFHFRGDDVFKLVRDLSGGEKSRLKMCVLMYRGVNVLILDEPTNHLDIRSTEWIEEAIENYDGTLLLISHDRYFLSKFAERIWMVDDNRILDFNGGYEELKIFLEKLKELETPELKAPEKKPSREDGRNRRNRESENARKRLPILERDIERQEQQIEELEEQIALVSSDHVKLTEILERRDRLMDELEALLMEWEDTALLSEQ